MFKWKLTWKQRELLAVLGAWLRGAGTLIEALTAWAEVITYQVRDIDRMATTPAGEAHLAQADLRKLAKARDSPALHELIEY